MKQGVSPPQKPTVLHVTLGYKLTAKASQWLLHYSMKPSHPEMPQPQETFPFQWLLWDKLKDCVLKFLLYFFLLSAVLHCISKWSRSTWLAGSCQYATLRLVWRGSISRLPEPCTCHPLQNNWNTSLPWMDLPHSHGFCDMRPLTPTSQRELKNAEAPWSTQNTPSWRKRGESYSTKLNSAFKVPAHPFPPSFMFAENTTEPIHLRFS